MAIRPNFTGNYNQDFVHDPNGFMDWHLVVSSVKTSRVGANFTEKVTFKQLPTSFCMKTDNAGGGRSIPVLILRNARDDEVGIDAYVCDYESGNLKLQMIDRAAKYCFTFAMDGCSFGIGNPTPEGAVLVSHVNIKGGGSNAANVANQRVALEGTHGTVGSTFMEPHMYMGGDPNKATTFGVRNVLKSEWNFYYQNFRVEGPGQYLYLGQQVLR